MTSVRVELRRLRPGELDHELVWLVVTVSAALLACAWFALQLPWPHCAFRALTGLPCVTCGATRSGLAFLHGDLAGAWRFNPLVFVGFCAIAIFDLYAFAVLIMRARRLRVVSAQPPTRKLILTAIVLAGLANWIYLLRR